MEIEHIIQLLETTSSVIIREVSKTRPQEMVIMGLLVIAIGIGIANLIAIKKK